MSNQSYWFQYSTTAIYPYLQENSPPSGSGLSVLGGFPQDTAPSNVVMAYNFPNRYLVVSGVLTLQPYFTISTSQTGSTVTLTATLNNPPATMPTSATFTVLGTTFSEPLSTSGVVTFTMDIHPSLSTSQVQVTVGATSCVNGIVTLGSQNPLVGMQIYTPTSGNPTVAPTGVGSLMYLQDYYTSLIQSAKSVSDIATLLGIVVHFLFNKVSPALTSGTTPLLTLDANENNAYKDIMSSVLPNIISTLENIAPVPASGATQTYEVHYANVRTDYPSVAQALTGYATDVATIPNLA